MHRENLPGLRACTLLVGSSTFQVACSDIFPSLFLFFDDVRWPFVWVIRASVTVFLPLDAVYVHGPFFPAFGWEKVGIKCE